MRIGIGFDIHRFGGDGELVLGGVVFPGEEGLLGHSDADVLTHAVIDALLGAVAMGDLGEHFPDTDERWKGASSLELLRQTVRLLEGNNYQVVNVDVTVVAERPHLRERAPEMREKLSGILGIGPDFVSIKATTAEGLGALGRGEGISARAVALVDRIEEPSLP